MPVTYSINKKTGTIHTKIYGNATFEEVAGHFETLIQDPDCPDRLDVLLDLSEGTSMPEPNELMDVSKIMGSIRARVRFKDCAIVAPKDALFGMMRMFEVFAEKQFRTTCVFRTVEEAKIWLASHKPEDA